MLEKIKVSIVTVCYNSDQTIKDTIESVLNQTYSNIEYIIIDGNSKDSTISIIKSYELAFKEKNIPYLWISEPDKGIYDAMNKGLALAKGDLIGILNSDDWYANNAILDIVGVNNNHEYSIISGKKTKVDKNKKLLKTFQNKKDVKKHIYKTMPLNFPATFVHKTVYNNIGVFNTQYQLSADYDLIYRAFNKKTTFLFTDTVVAYMRNTGATHQTKNLFVTAKEDLQIRKNNKVKAAYFYYLKRLGFNFLVIIRDVLRSFLKNN